MESLRAIGGFIMIFKNCRINWAHLEKPTKNLNGDEIYDLMLIIDKNDTVTIETFKKEIQDTLNKAKEENGAKAIQGARIPELKDGDNPDHNKKNAEYLKGKYFITVKNKRQPLLEKAVKKDGKAIKVAAESGEIYNGCYVYASVNPYFYSNNVNRGITLYLNTVIKTRDGERLGRAVEDIEIDFDDIGLAEDDDDWTTI
jgi:hypothetical protein